MPKFKRSPLNPPKRIPPAYGKMLDDYIAARAKAKVNTRRYNERKHAEHLRSLQRSTP